ncbi:MAG: hypothetical protein KKF27_20820, partial [Gammaproteobacteria bacterium]|nr:hypothetical protein [Gammaproteobacteria bacterium]MBU2685693.1 hypothetical protein [Gammaproteobacteria bacterium]
MPLLPESAITNPPVWDPDTIFQYDWTTAESSSLWTTYTNVSEQTSGGIDNSGYARLGSTATMKKTINQMGSLYFRFGVRIASAGTQDREVCVINHPVYGDLIPPLTYSYATHRLSFGSYDWAAGADWNVIEIYFGMTEDKTIYYVNGSLIT